MQALNMVHKKWEGFGYDNEGVERVVFTLKDPKDSCLVQNGSIRILVHGKPKISTRNIYNKNNNYVEINGSFAERACNIIGSDGRVIAQVCIIYTFLLTSLITTRVRFFPVLVIIFAIIDVWPSWWWGFINFKFLTE